MLEPFIDRYGVAIYRLTLPVHRMRKLADLVSKFDVGRPAMLNRMRTACVGHPESDDVTIELFEVEADIVRPALEEG